MSPEVDGFYPGQDVLGNIEAAGAAGDGGCVVAGVAGGVDVA